jgi:hypothetical protein
MIYAYDAIASQREQLNREKRWRREIAYLEDIRFGFGDAN